MSTSPASAFVGRYRLQRMLGQDPQGAVYAVQDLADGRQLALRLLPPSNRPPDGFQRQCLCGTDDAPGLRHPNIVALHDVGWHDGRIFVVTEEPDGESLPEHLARVGRLPMLQGLALVAQLLSALELAHSRQCIHAAISADHLRISPSGRLRITGFGWAASAPREAGGQAALAPEQRRGRPVDHRTDLYAAAVVAYELLAGAPLANPVRSDLPAELRAVFGRALAPEPEARYPSAAELSAAFRAAVGAPVWDRTPPTRRPVRPTPSRTMVAVAPPALEPEPAQLPAVAAPATLAVQAPGRPHSPRWRHAVAVAVVVAGVAAAVLLMRTPLPGAPDADVRPLPAPEKPEPVAASRAAPPAAWAPQPGPGQPPAPEQAMPSPSQPLPALLAPGIAPPARDMAPVPKRPRTLEARAPAQSPGSDHGQVRQVARSGAASAPATTSRPRRAAAATRVAHASRPDATCRQDRAFAREICAGVRCLSPEFRGHPMCLRMQDAHRAREAVRAMYRAY